MSIKNYSQQLRDEWKVVLCSVFRPAVIIPLCFTTVSLYFANAENIDKRFSLVLQAVATISLAVAGGCFWDTFRTATGNDLLIKKGASAVRNLSLSRLKTKNISERTKGNATSEEISNLLTILEKDIANAIQEWNDILPGVGAQEGFYALFAEKEAELELAKKANEELNKRLEEDKQLSQKEKQDLKRELVKNTQKICDLEDEINKLRKETILPLGLKEFPSLINRSKYSLGSILGQTPTSKMICSKCKKEYTDLYVGQLLGESLCLECRSEGIISFRERP